MDRGLIFWPEAMVWHLKGLNDEFVSYKHAAHKKLTEGLERCELIEDYCDVFISCLDSFWRHPFTAEHPLVSKWCNAKLLHICSHEETCIYIFNGLRMSKCLYFKFWVNYSFTNDFTMLVQTAFFGHNGDLKWEITLQSECYQTNKQKKSHFE